MERYPSVHSFIASDALDGPAICARPHKAQAAARWFLDRFPGDVLYAVKVNPAPWLIDTLYDAGVRWFDAASLTEVRLVAERCPDANIAFLHPVKSRSAIRTAYYEYGVRIFALDSHAELQKIIEETGYAKDLELIVRMAVSNKGAALPLGAKFGVGQRAMPSLLRAARAHADELGVSFHVGSQCMDPAAYRNAMAQASACIVKAGVTVDIVDVGGGFPSTYPGLEPPPLDVYIAAIADAFEGMMVLENADLWCEPGRALAAESGSLLTQVELVKPGAVYLNDGAYGALFDAAHENWRYPVRSLRDGEALDGPTKAMRVYGPTCDSADRLAKKVLLPATLEEGDFLEFGNLGAYGEAMATQFNGFGRYSAAIVEDSPFASLYRPSADILEFPAARLSGAAL